MNSEPLNLSKNHITLDSLQFNPSAEDILDNDMFEIHSNKKDKMILFDHHAKIYRYLEKTKEWKEHGTGKMKVLANLDISSTVQLLLYHDEGSICFRQLIERGTKFNETQMSQAALTWIGQDLSEYRAEKEPWAIKFDDIDTCKKFNNIIFVATSVPIKDELSSAEFMYQLLFRNIQTWNYINSSLEITTEDRKRFYERKFHIQD